MEPPSFGFIISYNRTGAPGKIVRGAAQRVSTLSVASAQQCVAVRAWWPGPAGGGPRHRSRHPTGTNDSSAAGSARRPCLAWAPPREQLLRTQVVPARHFRDHHPRRQALGRDPRFLLRSAAG
jgi:hypothetical protein